MKKVFRCMCMIALVALVFTSCKKEEEKTTIHVISQDLVEADDVDRAYIDMNDQFRHIIFEEGDMCMIYNISVETPGPEYSHSATYEAVTTGNNVQFVNCGWGSVGHRMDDAFYAYYPAGPSYIRDRLDEGNNVNEFYVKPTQNYRTVDGEPAIPDKAMYMAAKVADANKVADADFYFKNICGVFAFKLWDANGIANVTQVQVYDLNMDLSGWVELVIPEVDPDEMISLFNNYSADPAYLVELGQYLERVGYHASETGNHITLNMPDGGVQIGNTKATASQFYMILRPLAMSQGAHVIVTYATGEVKDVYIPAGTITMAPNAIKRATINLANW